MDPQEEGLPPMPTRQELEEALQRLQKLYPKKDYQLKRDGTGLIIMTGKKTRAANIVCLKHGRELRFCKDIECGGGQSLCKKHRRRKRTCPDPECGGGSGLCKKHSRRKDICPDPECGGGNLLCTKHKRQKQVCPDPECGGGASRCTKHNRRKYLCHDPECGGGGGLCLKHCRQKNMCPDPECGGGNNLCTKHKRKLGECSDPECKGGSLLCIHLISRSMCPDPNCGGGGSFCKHLIYRWLCPDPECKGGSSLCKKHNKKLYECPDLECGGGTGLCRHLIVRNMCPDITCGGGTCLCSCGKHAIKDGYCTRCHPDYVESMAGCSKIACQCIDDLENATGISIQHKHFDYLQASVVGLEHRPIGWIKKPVDGFYIDPNDGMPVAFEFLGSYYHGHPSLWTKGTTHFGTPFKDLFEKTERTFQKVLSLGYRVRYVWEYDYVNLDGLHSVEFICREFTGILEY